MALASVLNKREIQNQVHALDELLTSIVDLKAQCIALQTGISLREVRQAMHEGCEERMRDFANTREKKSEIKRSRARSRGTAPLRH